MPILSGLNTIIHAGVDADVSTYTYTKIYAAGAATPTINGTVVTMVAGSTIDILIRSLSGTLTNVFVIGDKSSTIDPGGTVGIIL